MLNEGQNNKGALKMVFLAGTPGSGKNYIADQLFGIQKGTNFSASGLKLVSFDAIFESMLKANNIDPKNLASMSKEELEPITSTSNPNSLFVHARAILKKSLKHHMKAGNGIIFDGTGQSTSAYFEKKDLAEELGYDTYMLYVEAPLNKALERNANRSRRLPDSLISQIHRAIKLNKKAYENDFGEDMIVIDNGVDGAKISPDAFKKINEITNGPVKNKKGRYFLAKGKRPWLAPKPKLPKDFDPNKPKILPPAASVHGYSPQPPSGQFDWWKKFMPQEQPPAPVQSAPESLNDPVRHDVRNDRQRNDVEQNDRQQPLTAQGNDTPSASKDTLKGKRIRNQQTGNDVLITTALKYPPGHPMRSLAEKERDRILYNK